MMCSTFSTSTANCITDRQFMSECSTRLEMFLCTNTSPGSMPRIWLAGTRESEQPIHRNFGVCCLDRRVKNPGSCARIDWDQRRLFSSSSCGDGMMESGKSAAAPPVKGENGKEKSKREFAILP